MKKYMLTVQHTGQKVSYTEFMAENDNIAKIEGEKIFKNYQVEKFFMTKQPYISGNFTGAKPSIKYHTVSKWVYSDTAISVWGYLTGGYWTELQ